MLFTALIFGHKQQFETWKAGYVNIFGLQSFTSIYLVKLLLNFSFYEKVNRGLPQVYLQTEPGNGKTFCANQQCMSIIPSCYSTGIV